MQNKKGGKTEKKKNRAIPTTQTPVERGHCYAAIHSFGCPRPPFQTIAFYHKRLLSLRVYTVYVPLIEGVRKSFMKINYVEFIVSCALMIISNQYRFKTRVKSRCTNRTIAKRKISYSL